jgi:hypothetical protein
MLSKDICIACVNARRRDREGVIVPWNGMDDSEWDDGRASCEDLYLGNPNIERHGASAAVDELPPERCPFRLEQILAGEKA